MKKIPLLPVICAAVVFLLTTAFKPNNTITNKNSLKTGANFADFVVGMKNETVYSLRDLAGKRFIVLAFLDSSLSSSLLSKRVMENIKSIAASKPDLLWLNITREKQHAVIYEATSVLNLRYRTLYSNLPRSYSFGSWPAVLIIDPRGIVQFIYVGYSPTIVSDIKKWLREAK